MLDVTALTRREQGKAERRARIIEAATALLRESGFDAVSMLQIAERAGVSPATVYNLFQTKAAVLQQVFDQDLTHYERLVADAPATDALERVFAAVDIAAALYEGDPGFYRAMAQGGRGPETLRVAISEPRIGFWRRMVVEARNDGRLRPDTDADLLGVALTQTARGVFHEWAAGVISAPRLAEETGYGFALALLAYAAPDAAWRLGARIAALEARLAAQDRHEHRQ